MKQIKSLMIDILCNGQRRETRSGVVRGVFKREFKHDMRESLPFPMTKKLMFKAMMGELLWFLNGEVTLGALRYRSNMTDDAWTIWTNDCERWHDLPVVQCNPNFNSDSLGKLYGHQWRRFGETNLVEGVDQIANLVYRMKNDKMSRYHIVQAYNPFDNEHGMMALPPCHTGFQVYVDAETGEFDLDWTQRSVDVFLGLPFNIASYGMLMVILGELTGLKPRFLYGSLKDVHIYDNHLPAVHTQLMRNDRHCHAMVGLPEINSLSDLEELTADDFALCEYDPDPAIKAPLSVG